MRTYSHAIITFAALRVMDLSKKEATFAALGATIPDLPAGTGAAWLWMKKRSTSRQDFDREVCGRNVFRVPDAAAHSFFVLLTAIAVCRRSRTLRPLLIGWMGHLVVDFLTHSSDARPQLWPISECRFKSPVSYREKEEHGRLFTAWEHALVVSAFLYLVRGSESD